MGVNIFAIGTKKTPKYIFSNLFIFNKKINDTKKPEIKINEVGLGMLYGSDPVKNL
jgi:hypothetical protein